MAEVKSGVKTTEFWISLAVTALGGVITMVPAESIWAKVIGGALTLAGVLGYGAMRASVKKAAVSAGPAPKPK